MDGLNVNVPAALQEFVEARVVEGGYQSVGEYVGELIRADQKQYALAVLGAEIMRGAASGLSVPMTGADWNDIRSEVQKRVESRTIG